MSYAICLRCGAQKVTYMDACPTCQFRPSSQDEIASSLILSSELYLESIDLPKSDVELRRLSAAIASGEAEILDDRELQAVKAFLLAAEKFQKRWTLSRVVTLGVVPVLFLLAFVVYLLGAILRS